MRTLTENSNSTVEQLYTDILEFSKLFFMFKLNFSSQNDDTLEESVLRKKLSKDTEDLLVKMDECYKRVENDLNSFKTLLTKKLQYKNKKDWFRDHLNYRDFLQTCENTLKQHDEFLRKDLKPLKNMFTSLISKIKELNKVIEVYNEYAIWKFPLISEKFETLNKIIILGFDITVPQTMTIKEFQKLYPEADLPFIRYLKGINLNLTRKQTEYEWLSILEKYFDTFNIGDFADVVYPKI